MKRKVLILPSWFPHEVSPISGIFIQDQAEEIAKKYDVAVLFPRGVLYQDMLRGRLGPKSQVQQCGGVMVYSERTLAPLPSRFKLFYDSYYRVARRGFEKLLHAWGKPDLIHAHVVLPGGWAALKIGQEYGIPVVLTEHSGPFSVHLQTEGQRRLVRETLMHIHQVIAVSPDLARQILMFQNELEIEVLGNMVRTEFFVPSEDKRKHSSPVKCFLSVAMLSQKKGLNYLLGAASLLVQGGVTSFELIIGGDGSERRRLEKQVQSLRLSNRCHFLGMLSRSQVRDWIQQCDVFVLPSLHETFGMVLAEAMACGKPVIATRCGGPEFIVTPEAGILVDTANSKALADMMVKVISGQVTFNPAAIRQSVTERFGEQAFLRDISRIYERLWAKEN
jgi:glycosyltransferase involved in cell wall biosynthesis